MYMYGHLFDTMVHGFCISTFTIVQRHVEQGVAHLGANAHLGAAPAALAYGQNAPMMVAMVVVSVAQHL